MKRSFLLRLMAAVGLACCLFSLGRRVLLEHADRSVAYAITYDTLLSLSAGSENSPEEWLDRLSAAGLGCLAATDAQETEARALAEKAGLGFGRVGTVPRPGDAFLLPPAGSLPQPDGAAPLCLAENAARNGIDLSPDFDPLAYAGPAVKTLVVFPAYAENYVSGDGTPSEPENILFRAVTDRSVRLILLAPLTDPAGKPVTDPAAYTGLLESLTQRLNARSLRAGGTFSCLAAPARSRVLTAGMCLLPAAMAVFFLGLLVPLSPLWEGLLLGLGAAAALGGGLLLPDLLLKTVPLGTALLAGCFAGYWLAELRKPDGPPGGVRQDWYRYLTALAGLLALSLGGGLVIGALLADRAYLWGFAVFTGVKLSQLLPVVFTGGLLALRLRPWERRAAVRRFPLIPVLLFLAVGAALALLVLRSGDNLLQAGQRERDFRNALEQLLYVRPRTKEFLLAFPALALYVLACERKADAAALPLGIIAEVGAVSVINTFCHLFTPLRVSLARTVLSGLMGLVLGLALLFIAGLFPFGKEENEEAGEP